MVHLQTTGCYRIIKTSGWETVCRKSLEICKSAVETNTTQMQVQIAMNCFFYVFVWHAIILIDKQ